MYKTTLSLITVLALVFGVSYCAAVEKPTIRDEQRAWEEKYDKLTIRHSAEMKTDMSKDFLKIPKNFDEDRNFDIANIPPTIDFAVIRNLGIPLEGASWPYFNYDYRQNLLFAVSHDGDDVLVYDTKDGRMVYGGAPPDNIQWYARCIMIDTDTGNIYTTDARSKEKQFIRYRRRNNEFTRMKATVPVNPKTGKRGDCRAHTSKKDADGAFWCWDSSGSIFRFYPDKDRTEYVTENWGKNGYYTANMEMSPDGRFLYYIPGLSEPQARGVPIVQLDTKTLKKKVIAFIFDYYMDKYGYAPVRAYGLELDEKGESLFFYVNGGFGTWEQENPMLIAMRRPGIFHVHIPESERK